MLVQTYFPQRLSPSRYDTFLASGWFRGSVMLYKMDLLCIEEDLYSVVNIRLNLEQFEQSKSQRKKFKKVQDRFRVEIGKATYSEEKDALYQKHKYKFRGFIHATLDDYLSSGFPTTVFNTQEVCVYDGNKLIAVSFFDLGEKSVASLLALYDENYQRFSLGVFTMLKEVDFAQKLGYKWYYPGYILDKESSFSYKLDLGEFEHYNHNKHWVSYKQYEPEGSLAYTINEELDLVMDELASAGIKAVSKLYPYFSMGYMGYWKMNFIKYPRILILEIKENNILGISYDGEAKQFDLFWCQRSPAYDHLINMEVSREFQESDNYLMELLHLEEHKHTTYNAADMALFCKNHINLT